MPYLQIGSKGAAAAHSLELVRWRATAGGVPNYFYGSAKAGFTAFLSGLRGRLATKGVHVVTVKPGYVDTKMLSAKSSPRMLTATPADVAEGVAAAVSRKKDVIYVKPIWTLVMTVVRAMPESLFKRGHF